MLISINTITTNCF